MLKSMTGFGRGEGETTLGKLYVESRSVNHRYCDINLKLPKRLAVFENLIKEVVRSFVNRGRIDVSLKLDSVGEDKVQFSVDLHLAKQYFNALQLVKEKLQVKDDISLGLLAGIKDLITPKEEIGDMEPYWEEIVPVLKYSIRDMDKMKQFEGEALTKDLRQRLACIDRELAFIQSQYQARLEAYQNRLSERLRSLLGSLEVDFSRFQQEVAFLAERTDITEEIIRTKSHLTQFANLLEGKEPVGRKMEFLLQEIHREVNTVSAKVNDAEISQKVVDMKSELEKIREQVQNIE